VAPLVKKWGFESTERASTSVPSEAELAAWAATRPTFADLDLAGTEVSSRTPNLQVDLGAIAKGRVVDLAIAILKKNGIDNALIDAGGNLRAIGRAGDRPWRVAIRDPRSDQPLGWIELSQDESASTSGDYERFAMVGQQRIHHLLDPHTGRPVTHTMAVTVLAADATTADAASTAIMAAGPEHWLKIARQMRLRYVLRIAENGDIEMSSGLRSRLHFSATVVQQHKISLVDL
jgi:thiamine biosynthesis lipoprotein